MKPRIPASRLAFEAACRGDVLTKIGPIGRHEAIISLKHEAEALRGAYPRSFLGLSFSLQVDRLRRESGEPA